MLFIDNLIAKFNTFVTDENLRPGNELLHIMLRFSAECATKCNRDVLILRFAFSPNVICCYETGDFLNQVVVQDRGWYLVLHLPLF